MAIAVLIHHAHPTMQSLEKTDIQGLVARGYSKLPEAHFLLLQFSDATKAKTWLNALSNRVTPASQSPPDKALQLAVTSDGLRALNLSTDILATFSREFLEGMATPDRAYHLGDVNANDPDLWQWGGPNNPAVHAMLMCYAVDAAALTQLCQSEEQTANAAGITVLHSFDSHTLPEHKEHFGFRDGVSQPPMEGLAKRSDNPVKAGEFVLGYRNAYERFSDSPTVKPGDDPQSLLPALPDKSGLRDLGKNGSYLVYRQMTQDVFGFWKYLEQHSKEPASNSVEAAVALGAKMVGRWPGGAPLVTSPDKDDPTKARDNDFGYWQDDPKGMKCPFGSHIRRTNPRDWLFTERQQNVSEEMVGKHRIMRRGRSFGAPLVPSLSPKDVLHTQDDGAARGLHFICLVGNLSRQFEFLQNAWVKTPTFAGLYADADPLLAARQAPGEHPTDEFTCPAQPFRRKYKGMPQFSTVVGGAYFFLPGINALRFLATV